MLKKLVLAQLIVASVLGLPAQDIAALNPEIIEETAAAVGEPQVVDVETTDSKVSEIDLGDAKVEENGIANELTQNYFWSDWKNGNSAGTDDCDHTNCMGCPRCAKSLVCPWAIFEDPDDGACGGHNKRKKDRCDDDRWCDDDCCYYDDYYDYDDYYWPDYDDCYPERPHHHGCNDDYPPHHHRPHHRPDQCRDDDWYPGCNEGPHDHPRRHHGYRDGYYDCEYPPDRFIPVTSVVTGTNLRTETRTRTSLDVEMSPTTIVTTIIHTGVSTETHLIFPERTYEEIYTSYVVSYSELPKPTYTCVPTRYPPHHCEPRPTHAPPPPCKPEPSCDGNGHHSNGHKHHHKGDRHHHNKGNRHHCS